jgi:hypothetical protein
MRYCKVDLLLALQGYDLVPEEVYKQIIATNSAGV